MYTCLFIMYTDIDVFTCKYIHACTFICRQRLPQVNKKPLDDAKRGISGTNGKVIAIKGPQTRCWHGWHAQAPAVSCRLRSKLTLQLLRPWVTRMIGRPVEFLPWVATVATPCALYLRSGERINFIQPWPSMTSNGHPVTTINSQQLVR